MPMVGFLRTVPSDSIAMSRMIACLLAGLLWVGTAVRGECLPRLCKRCNPPAPSAPAPGPLPTPAPYSGQAMGATPFNYGYFGAHRHCQLTKSVGYYGDYYQKGHIRDD